MSEPPPSAPPPAAGLAAPHPPTAEIDVDDAVARILAAVGVVGPPERVAFHAATGRVVAAPVVAPDAMPPFAASARDGYAVVAADGAGPRRVVGEAVAGAGAGVAVGRGEAARITTGAPLPPGADAVVMVEDTRPAGAAAPAGPGPSAAGHADVEIRRAVAPGENVRPVGQDHAAGDVLVPAGVVVGAAEVGLMASAGAVAVDVHRRPRVIVFSTGDEVVEPEGALRPGQIRDSNRFALAEAARAAGAEVVFAGHLGDEAADLDALAAAVASADAVVTSGGVSMGHRDLVKPWLAAHGELVFGRVRTKPGKPVTFARVGGTPCFALPGFPVSALVCFELFVRPALLVMGGRDPADAHRPVWPVRLAHDLAHAGDRVEFARAVVRLGADGRPEAATTGFQGSGRLLSLAGANALLRLEGAAGRTPAGATVPALIVGPVGGPLEGPREGTA